MINGKNKIAMDDEILRSMGYNSEFPLHSCISCVTIYVVINIQALVYLNIVQIIWNFHMKETNFIVSCRFCILGRKYWSVVRRSPFNREVLDRGSTSVSYCERGTYRGGGHLAVWTSVRLTASVACLLCDNSDF